MFDTIFKCTKYIASFIIIILCVNVFYIEQRVFNLQHFCYKSMFIKSVCGDINIQNVTMLWLVNIF